MDCKNSKQRICSEETVLDYESLDQTCNIKKSTVGKIYGQSTNTGKRRVDSEHFQWRRRIAVDSEVVPKRA